MTALCYHGSDMGQEEGRGMGLLVAVFFIAGEMAGSGLLALPAALLDTGWSGILLITFFSVNGAYIGARLGKCWEILEESHDEFKERYVRDAYPRIAELAGATYSRTLGKIMGAVALGSILLTLYGASVIFMEIIAETLEAVIGSDKICFCALLLIVAAVLCPLTWLGTPKDFWPLAIGALGATCLAAILIIIQIRLDVSNNTVPGAVNCSKRADTFDPTFPQPEWGDYFEAFGSIMFAFGGASIFPTIQADMEDRAKFKYAAAMAILILFLLYTPFAATAYFSLGACAEAGNAIDNLSDGTLKKASSIVIMLHLVSAFPTVINPPCQYFEAKLNIPTNFNWKRCVFRSASMVVLVIIAELLPSFGPILSLIGGSTITCITFLLPPASYLLLMKTSPDRRIPLPEEIYLWFLILVGFAGGMSASYSAVDALFFSKESVVARPCFVNWRFSPD